MKEMYRKMQKVNIEKIYLSEILRYQMKLLEL